MGFFDLLAKAGGAILENAEKSQIGTSLNAKKFLEQYETRINQVEKSGAMDDPEKARKLLEAKEKLEKAREHFDSSGEMLIGGKTFSQWNSEWQSIGYLETTDLSPYNHCVGLYRHVIDGKTMYIGRAIELYNGGFRKRLSDYRRESDSARLHTSGRIINENLSKIITYVLVVGNTDEAIENTKKLEGLFVRQCHPSWNKMINI